MVTASFRFLLTGWGIRWCAGASLSVSDIRTLDIHTLDNMTPANRERAIAPLLCSCPLPSRLA
jgi:hypothetical protein